MSSRVWLPLMAAVAVTTSAACAGNSKPQTPIAATIPVERPVQLDPALAAPPAPDPVTALIATSQKHFEAGERELRLGHLDRARTEFDRAVDVLLESPYGARTDARMREHFDRLIDRVNAHEVTALAQGDGFAEKKYEPASIDELLKIATFAKPPADAETTAAVKDDLARTAHDIDIPQNSRVLSAVELLQGRLRDYVQESLARGANYLPMIQNVFRAEGLPLDLAFIPIIESGFKTNALSKASAKGPWQFMIPTAKDHGLKTDWFIDERSDFEKSTVAAAKYLKMLARLFDNDWHLVLAAYNGGQGRVQRAMKRAGKDDFWDLSETQKFLPKETREYVPLILAGMIIGRNPVQYGFEVASAEPVAYEKVSIQRAIDLRRVAEWTGTSVDEIQALNPELRRWTTPVRYPDYEVKVPAGTGEQFRTRLAAATSDDLTTLKWHTVRRGETLITIARKLRVSKTELAAANNLSTRARVPVGRDLIIPRAPATLLATRTERAAPAVAASRPLSGTGSVPDSLRASTSNSATYYKVQRGDTLSKIARLFNTSVDKIKSWNRLRGNRISAGTRLVVKKR
ncbi:MAG: LysM peptidoglycan-binding domain-containing protein [Acidobacteria bacterium]|nr:LysM peptidoglycan-binding domain-containing protein [Acidobacteriota bacterium]